MNDRQKDDVFYVCCLIEYVSRITKNHRWEVVRRLGADEIHRMLDNAEINHCLSFEQVGEEIVEQYKIPEGDFDTVAKCEYTVPGYLEIGRVYQQLVLSIGAKQRPEDAIYSVFVSFISAALSDFNTNVYYSNPDYLRCSFLEGKLLA